VWLSRYREGQNDDPGILADARARAETGFDFLQRELGEKTYLLGDEFSAADVMMGFTLAAASIVGVLGDQHQPLKDYLERLMSRPAFAAAMAAG
jgi:glutathione S-transferase